MTETARWATTWANDTQRNTMGAEQSTAIRSGGNQFIRVGERYISISKVKYIEKEYCPAFGTRTTHDGEWRITFTFDKDNTLTVGKYDTQEEANEALTEMMDSFQNGDEEESDGDEEQSEAVQKLVSLLTNSSKLPQDDDASASGNGDDSDASASGNEGDSGAQTPVDEAELLLASSSVD